MALNSLELAAVPAGVDRALFIVRSIGLGYVRDPAVMGIAVQAAPTDPGSARHIAWSLPEPLRMRTLAEIDKVVAATNPDHARMELYEQWAREDPSWASGTDMW